MAAPLMAMDTAPEVVPGALSVTATTGVSCVKFTADTASLMTFSASAVVGAVSPGPTPFITFTRVAATGVDPAATGFFGKLAGRSPAATSPFISVAFVLELVVIKDVSAAVFALSAVTFVATIVIYGFPLT